MLLHARSVRARDVVEKHLFFWLALLAVATSFAADAAGSSLSDTSSVTTVAVSAAMSIPLKDLPYVRSANSIEFLDEINRKGTLIGGSQLLPYMTLEAVKGIRSADVIFTVSAMERRRIGARMADGSETQIYIGEVERQRNERDRLRAEKERRAREEEALRIQQMREEKEAAELAEEQRREAAARRRANLLRTGLAVSFGIVAIAGAIWHVRRVPKWALGQSSSTAYSTKGFLL